MDKINLADQLEAWAKRNEVATLAAKAFREVGQLEQAKAEQERALIDVNAKLDAARVSLAAATADIHKASVQAEDIRAAATKKADDTVRVAAQEAEKIRAEVLVKAEQERAKASSEAAKILAEAKKEKAEWMNEAKIAEDRAEAAIVKEDAAKRELAQLQDRISKARAAIKQMVGE